jgi:predicted nuclease of predicted toxin-antitoxin system
MIKLLLDQNLSFKIKSRVNDFFNGIQHTSDFKLIESSDFEIWNHAKNNNFCIVTFDSDFIDISVLNGFPPKIIWLRFGNSSTQGISQILINNHLIINEFLLSSENAYLEIR